MASPTTRVRLAPTRSAISPQTILPPSEARPATLSTVTAAIAVIPRSIAWVTMWKIGPEWAAQQAKYASAMAANWGVRRACPTVSSRPSAPRIPGAPAATVLGGGDDDQPRQVPDHEHRGAPVVGGDQVARQGPDGGGAEPDAGGDQRDRQAPVLREPAGGGGGQGSVEAARRETHQHPEQELELAERRGLARGDEPEPEQTAADEQDGAGAEPIGERAPEESAHAHPEPVDQRGGRDSGPGPPHRLGHGLEEDAERQHRPHADTGDDDPDADDNPAVEDLHGGPHPITDAAG